MVPFYWMLFTSGSLIRVLLSVGSINVGGVSYMVVWYICELAVSVCCIRVCWVYVVLDKTG